MSKPVKGKCPQCGKVKLYRADCKTCGYSRPQSDPLVGRFWRSTDENGVFLAGGQIRSRLSSTMYLVGFEDLDADGRICWNEKIVPLSSMGGWEISDEDMAAVELTLRIMEEEQQRAHACPVVS
jgi:hypothetical protein